MAKAELIKFVEALREVSGYKITDALVQQALDLMKKEKSDKEGSADGGN